MMGAPELPQFLLRSLMRSVGAGRRCHAPDEGGRGPWHPTSTRWDAAVPSRANSRVAAAPGGVPDQGELAVTGCWARQKSLRIPGSDPDLLLKLLLWTTGITPARLEAPVQISAIPGPGAAGEEGLWEGRSTWLCPLEEADQGSARPVPGSSPLPGRSTWLSSRSRTPAAAGPWVNSCCCSGIHRSR